MFQQVLQGRAWQAHGERQGRWWQLEHAVCMVVLPKQAVQKEVLCYKSKVAGRRHGSKGTRQEPEFQISSLRPW